MGRDTAGVNEDALVSSQSPAKAGNNHLKSTKKSPLARWLTALKNMFLRLPVLKEFFIIFSPESAWDQITASRRGNCFVFIIYWVPMFSLLGLVEGHGLILLGREQVAQGMDDRFTLAKVTIYEIGNGLITLGLVCLAALFIKYFANACHARNRLGQSLAVMLHASGPLLLVQLFNGFPDMYLWLTWLLGITVMLGTLYHGLPRMMQPDPPSAMGLYVGSAAIVFLLMLGGRLLTGFYLAGDFKKFEAHL
jgi:hypothetical protein